MRLSGINSLLSLGWNSSISFQVSQAVAEKMWKRIYWFFYKVRGPLELGIPLILKWWGLKLTGILCSYEDFWLKEGGKTTVDLYLWNYLVLTDSHLNAEFGRNLFHESLYWRKIFAIFVGGKFVGGKCLQFFIQKLHFWGNYIFCEKERI